MAMVFGREDKGLSNDELDFCRALVSIPTSAEYTSMNLAQAIGVMSYETWRVRIGADIPDQTAPSTGGPRGGRPDRVALYRLDARPVGHRLFQDPPTRPRHALVSGDRLPGGTRRAGGVAAAGDGHRGAPLSGTCGRGAGRRAARRPTPANRDTGPPYHGSGSLTGHGRPQSQCSRTRRGELEWETMARGRYAHIGASLGHRAPP